MKCPLCRTDATALTEAGYVGEDVENILLKLIQAADYDVNFAQMALFTLDDRQDHQKGRKCFHYPRRVRRRRTAGAS